MHKEHRPTSILAGVMTRMEHSDEFPHSLPAFHNSHGGCQ